MNQFEAAQAKHAKNLERRERYEERQVEKKTIEKSRKATPTIRVIVGGFDFTFVAPGLFGNLPSVAGTENGMREIVKQALETKFGKSIVWQPPSSPQSTESSA